MKSFELTSEIEKEIGKNYDCYDISVIDSNHSKVQIISEEIIKITLPMKSGKEISKVYEMDEDGTLKPVDYIITEEKEIVLSTHNLGQFIVTYKDKPVDKGVENEENSILPIALTGALVTLGLAGTTVYYFRKFKK